MDSKEILAKVLDAIVNEDNEAATEHFKTYATAKVKGLIEGDDSEEAKKIAKKKAKQCDDANETNKVAAGVTED